MRTRSQSRNLHHQQQQAPPAFVEPFNLEEPIENPAPPVVPMADNRTMAQLLQAPTEGYEDAIVIPEINANFELKHGLINLVQNKQFFGHDKEDPHAHIRYFNKITSTMKFPDIPSTSIKLMLFPFSLEGSARIWLEKEPPRSILTWDDLVSKFINQFFPPSKTTNLQNEIMRFQQRFDESFYEAWDRFNDLLRACPHHGFSELHQLDTFYNALNANDQDSLNSAAGGNFLDKMPRECLRIIESKSKLKPYQAPAQQVNGVSKTILRNYVMANVADEKYAKSVPSVFKINSQLTDFALHQNHNAYRLILGTRESLQVLRTNPKNGLEKVLPLEDDFKPDPRIPLILGRSFLKTSRALIDVYEGEITLRVGKEAITFNLDQTSRYTANYNHMTANRIDVIDMAFKEYSQEVLGFSNVISSGNPTPYYDPIVSTSSPTLTPFGDNDFLLFEEADSFLAIEDDPTSPEVDPTYYDPEGDILPLEAILNSDPSPPPNQGNYFPEIPKDLKICETNNEKSSVNEPPEVELKDLPPHLEYAFLEGNEKLPVIISKDLKNEEKAALIEVLKSHKRAIAWKLSDIKGIDLEFYTHKILMEEDYEPSVQHQRRSGIEVDRAKVDVIAKLPYPTTVKDKKRVENLAADHLSRLENPHQDKLENKEITETFPLETLGSVALRVDNTSWFVDFANYHAGNFIVKGMSSQQKNKFFKDVKHYFWDDPFLFKIFADQVIQRCVHGKEAPDILELATIDPPGTSRCKISPPKKGLDAGFFWRLLFLRCHELVLINAYRASDKEKFHNGNEMLKNSFQDWCTAQLLLQQLKRCFLFIAPLKLDLLLGELGHRFDDLRKPFNESPIRFTMVESTEQDYIEFCCGWKHLDKMPRECLKIIESKSKVRNSRNKAVVAKVSSNSSTPGISPDVAALTTEVSELKNMMKTMLIEKQKAQAPAPVKAVEQSCVTCGGAHSYRNCPTTNGNIYQDNIQEYVSQAAAANFNQGNTNFRPPMVANQIRPSAPAQQVQGVSKTDFENYVKANDAVLRNMQNQGQGLQNQIANLTDMLSKFVNANTASSSGTGTLPSNTVTNPKEDLKVERETEVTKDTMPPANNGSTKDVQPPVVPVVHHESISEPVNAPVSASMPNQKTSIPFPSRRNE
ncbi:reverse transcriptase domain-containing protein [Tanacetum coccineum]